GPEKFAELVAHIAPSLQTLRLDGAGPGAPPPAFAHRLLFAVRFADFPIRAQPAALGETQVLEDVMEEYDDLG
ncbi:uncharacterized protein BXZ73DRAFT_112064, partial [Epithele typhae]|uniref:uncharacterized protein n=1 Tax=Epithele typhae TaxID=378194 RepID=UPI002007293C